MLRDASGGGDPRGRRRDRRLERPVRAEPRHRRAGRDRDEPARLAVVGAGLQGHRLPDRQGRDQAGASATRWTRSPTTSPAPRRRRSSRRSTTWSSSCRGSRSRSSPAPTTRLTTQMKSVGEVMGIGRTLQRGVGQGDALARARRHAAHGGSRRRGRCGTASTPSRARLLAGDDPAARWPPSRACTAGSSTSGRAVAEAERSVRGADRGVAGRRRLAAAEAAGHRPTPGSRRSPAATRREVRRLRKAAGVRPVFKAVDSCAAEVVARAPYYYSAYEDEDELDRGERPSVIILGAGPNRIGQGIEFDYCCVQAAQTLRAPGLRRRDGQLQPGDGVDRRRLVRPTVLRAADGGGRARGDRARAAAGRGGAVRRPDAAAAGPAAGGGGRAAAGHAVRGDRHRRGSRAVRRRAPPSWGWRRPAWGIAGDVDEAVRDRRRDRLPGAGAAELRARRPGDAHLLRRGLAAGAAGRARLAGRPLRRGRDRGRRRRRLRRHAHAGSARSCSTSRRPGCTPATRPA